MQEETMVDRQVKAAREVYMKEKREKFESLKGHEPTDDELDNWMEIGSDNIRLRVEAEVHALALIKISKINNDLGRVMLATMWKVWIEGLHLHMGENATIEDWAINHILNQGEDIDHDYVKGMARAVDNILVWVHQYEKDDLPIETDDGKTIVIEGGKSNDEINLITSPGMISKLKENATFFSQLDSIDSKTEFIQILSTKSRSKLQAHKAITKNKQTKVELTGIKFKLTKRTEGDKIRITIPKQSMSLSPQQYRAFTEKFSDYIDISVQKPL